MPEALTGALASPKGVLATDNSSWYDPLIEKLMAILPTENLPTPAKLFAETVQGKKDKITEKDFTNDEIEFLRNMISHKEQTQGEWKSPSGLNYGKTDPGSIQYSDYHRYAEQYKKDYGKLYPGASIGILGMLSDPGKMISSLGQFNFNRNEDGSLTIKDNYKFNHRDISPLEYALSPVYGALRSYGQRKFPQGNGRDVEISIPSNRMFNE